jgi:hypothetical protein
LPVVQYKSYDAVCDVRVLALEAATRQSADFAVLDPFDV